MIFLHPRVFRLSPSFPEVRRSQRWSFLTPVRIFLLLICTPIGSVQSLAVGSRAKPKTPVGFGRPSTSKGQPQQYIPHDTLAIQHLTQTLLQQKAELEGTEIGTDCATGRRGLFATKNFSKDKIICKIPSAFALALSDPAISTSWKDTSLAQLGANFLTSYQLNENARAQWTFYLDGLPTQEFTPDFFTDDEIALLEFPLLVNAIRKRQEDIQRVSSETGIVAHTLQCAVSLVSSRSFGLTVARADDSIQKEAGDIALDDRGQVILPSGQDQSVVRVMVPYMDMANHKSSGTANAEWTVLDPARDNAWFALTANRNIPAGKEITISYGSSRVESSAELLLGYGFVDSGNPVDKFLLKKGGDGILNRDDWTTTLEEDQTMMNMMLDTATEQSEETLRKILQFRIQLKQSYEPASETSSS